jgi:hypothetical protein
MAQQIVVNNGVQEINETDHMKSFFDKLYSFIKIHQNTDINWKSTIVHWA